MSQPAPTQAKNTLEWATRLDSYQNHPEAKSVGPDGQPCDSETRALLQGAHIVANWPLIPIGKESDKHWEEGEGLSLLEFQTIQYRPVGKAIANEEQLARIAKSSGAFFFIWTLLALGVTALFSVILSARGLWEQLTRRTAEQHKQGA